PARRTRVDPDEEAQRPQEGAVADLRDRHLAAGPRRCVRAVARLLAADEAVRGLPHGRPVQRRALVERHSQGHARLVARLSTSGRERSARGGTTKFWRWVALTNELNPCWGARGSSARVEPSPS